MDNFLNNYEALDKAGKKAGNYVRDNAGAVEKIMHTVTLEVAESYNKTELKQRESIPLTSAPFSLLSSIVYS